MLLLCLLILGCQSGVGVQAASYPSKYTPEDIGLYTSNTSVVGLNFYAEDQLKFYVHDVWHNNGNEWYYEHTNLNGKVEPVTSTKYTSDPVWILDPSENKNRFDIILSNIKYHFGSYDTYSIVIEHYYNNKFIRRIVETPFQDVSSYKKAYSLMYCFINKEDVFSITRYEPDHASFKYKFYKILDIGKDSDIATASGNWSIGSNGKAYYDGENYVIHSLPTVTPKFEGYVSKLDGWYSDPKGGEKYEVGDTIQKGTKLYPHWSNTPIEYPVQCIDILGSDSSGLKIGESTWMQAYDSTAAGSQLGCIPLESVYYDGLVYRGCSQKVVRISNNVIYRYFDYAEYPVQIVDQIISGPNAGKKLQTVSRQGRYNSSVSASVLGTDKTVGAYYQGYSYQQSTSAIVSVNGATVYRYFVPVKYTIAFDGNGATSGNMAVIDDCWYDQEYMLIENDFKKEITIQFDLQAEDAVCDSQSKKATLQWNGWAENQSGKVRYADKDYVKNLQSDSGKVILYAVWGRAEVTVTAVPKRMGYVFAGWSEDPDATAGNTEFTLGEDTTLYAIWKPDVVEYHVEYYKENPDGNFQMTAQYTYSNYTGSDVSIQDIIPNYLGFYLDQGSSTLQGTVNGDGSLVLMAYYRRNTYQVIFDTLLENGTNSEYGSLQGVFEQEVQIPENIPQRKGYQFLGWTADLGSTQVYVGPGESYRIPNHDQTLYAIWQPNAYEIKFENNIPETESDTIKGSMSELTGHFEEDLVVPECGWERKGYEFVGWNTAADGSGTFYQAQEQVQSLYQEDNKTIILYAMWKALEGEIQYQINVPERASSIGIGEMEVTPYRYDDSWCLEKCHFQLPGYDFCGWNTREDGKGDSYQDQEEMCRKMPVSGVQNLYAVWKARTDTKFYLQIEKSTLDTQETFQEIMVMEGETDSSLSDAIIAYYQRQGVDTSIQDFVTGFTVLNAEVLEQNTVKAGEQTIVSLKVERKKYQVQILRDTADLESDCYQSEEVLYEDEYRFPESVDGIGNVKSYIDQDGNRHFPGEVMKIDHDYSFMAEHSVIYHIGEETQEKYATHNMPIMLEKPEEKEYYFQGWYWDKTYRDYAGNAEDILYITEDRNLYAKWSHEKKTYQIQYDLGNIPDIIFLEEPVSQYHYGDKVVLPVATQLLIPAKYEFVGWYDQNDADKSMVTMVPETAYGDKKYYLQLRKKNNQNDASGDSEKGQENSGDLEEKPENQEENSGQSPENPEKDQDDSQQYPGSSEGNQDDSQQYPGLLEENQGDSEKNPGTIEENSGSQKQDVGQISAQKDSKWVTDVISPIHSTKQKAAKTSSTSFTKGKVTYSCNHSKKNTVKVIAVDRNIKAVKIPSYVSWKGVRYSVTEIGQKAFSGCKKLKKVTIGKNITNIGKKAFYGCKKLRTVVFQGKKIKKIQKKAFTKTNSNLWFSIPKGSKKKYVCLLKKSGMNNINVRIRK